MEVALIITAVVVSFLLGFITCALLSSNVYNKGYKDGQKEIKNMVMSIIEKAEIKDEKNYCDLVKELTRKLRRGFDESNKKEW